MSDMEKSRRVFTWLDVFLWSIANPLASGLLFFSVTVTGFPGAYGGVIPLSFFFAGLLIYPLVLITAIFSSFFPRTGSFYYFITRGLDPVVGIIAICLYLYALFHGIGYLSYSSVKILGSALVTSGVITGDSQLVYLGEVFSKPITALVFGALVVIVVFALNISGVRVLKASLRITTLIPLVALSYILILSIPFSNTVFVNNWNRFFNGSYYSITQLALSGGPGIPRLEAVDPFTSTSYLILVALWAFFGVETTGFIAGEVENPHRSYWRGLLAGYSVLLALYIATPVVVTAFTGYEFISAYSYLYNFYRSELAGIMGTTPIEPGISLYLSIYFANKYLVILLGITGFLFYFNTVLTSFATVIRIFHAISSDKLMPGRSLRSHYYIAFTLSLLVLTPFYLVEVYPVLKLALFGIAVLNYGFFMVFIGISALSISLVRERLFRQLVFKNRKLMVISGVILTSTGFASTLIGLGESLIIVGFTMIVSLLILGMLVLMVYTGRKRGVDYEVLFSEIPPY